jgi:hypothetical protein
MNLCTLLGFTPNFPGPLLQPVVAGGNMVVGMRPLMSRLRPSEASS